MSIAPANGEKDGLDGTQFTPRVIPRSGHPISRKNIDTEALKVLYRLRDAGHTAYLVGGGVRDLYLGKTPKDFDISTDARPGQLRKLFRNSRLIGRRFRLVQVFFHGGKIIEVSTFRRRSEYDINGKEQVLASNNTFGTPMEDAFRRDLTINALFYEIENFTIIDYTGGVEDLDNGIIRMVGEAERRIIRDPARMLRVIRHAARNNFSIEESAWQATRKHRDKLMLCPVSRIRDELMKDLRGGASANWSTLAVDSGLLEVILPCYRSAQANSGRKKLLHDILAVVDRLLNKGAGLSDHMHLALLLIPWAEEEMNLSATVLKGREAYQFARTMRIRIDDILSHLSIKKSSKEAITTLLANLSQFKRYGRKDNSWPNWLKKKSYFNDCRRFYSIYQEALGESRTNIALFSEKPAKKEKTFNQPRKRRNRPGRSRPAVAGKGRSTIFGLKK